MTVLEALKTMREDLSKIPVKVADMNEIGLPIHRAVQNLGVVIDALEKAEEAQHADNADDKREDV